jgi:hypothetical protein
MRQPLADRVVLERLLHWGPAGPTEKRHVAVGCPERDLNVRGSGSVVDPPRSRRSPGPGTTVARGAVWVRRVEDWAHRRAASRPTRRRAGAGRARSKGRTQGPRGLRTRRRRRREAPRSNASPQRERACALAASLHRVDEWLFGSGVPRSSPRPSFGNDPSRTATSTGVADRRLGGSLR